MSPYLKSCVDGELFPGANEKQENFPGYDMLFILTHTAKFWRMCFSKKTIIFTEVTKPEDSLWILLFSAKSNCCLVWESKASASSPLRHYPRCWLCRYRGWHCVLSTFLCWACLFSLLPPENQQARASVMKCDFIRKTSFLNLLSQLSDVNCSLLLLCTSVKFHKEWLTLGIYQ